MPKISVLIPARNAEKTINETLSSLVRQTFRDFEVVVVNDASNDKTEEFANSFSTQIPTRVLTLNENSGVAGALIHGLKHIDADYIARLDADDIAHPRRLELQVDCMEQNPEFDVCGTQIGFFSGEFSAGSELRILSHPSANKAIKTALIQYCSIVHGSSMFKNSFFVDLGGYDLRYDFAEDYDLWCRGALLGKQYFNISETLTFVRKHAGQVSLNKAQLQYERDLAIKRKYLSALLGGESSGYLAEFFSLQTTFNSREIALAVIKQSIPLLFRICNKVFDEKIYSEIVSSSIERHLKG